MNLVWSLRIYLIVTLLVRVLFLAGVIVTGLQGNWESSLVSALGLILSFSPQIIERTLRVNLPIIYEFFIVIFIMLSVFMGEIGDAYTAFWWWDIMLHASSGVLLGYVGFLLLYILYSQKKLKASAGLIAFFTFAVGMASAGVWEVFEFSTDQLLGTHMQNGQEDTMWDIIVAGLGSLVAAGAAYIHIKWPTYSLYHKWVQKFFEANPQFMQRSSRKPVRKAKYVK